MHFKRSSWKPTENNLNLAGFWRFSCRERPFSQSSKYICLPFVFLLEKINIFKVCLIFKFHLVIRLNMAVGLTTSFHVKNLHQVSDLLLFTLTFWKLKLKNSQKASLKFPEVLQRILYCFTSVLQMMVDAQGPYGQVIPNTSQTGIPLNNSLWPFQIY